MIRLLVVIIFILNISQEGKSQTLAQWRGTDRKGVYTDIALKKSWPVGGPRLVWSLDDIGNGFGSPSIAGEQIFISGEEDSTAFLYCFDLLGKQIWKSSFGPEWVRSFPGSRSAPTVTENLVYVASGFGNVYCFDKQTGKALWNKDLINDFHGQPILHGHAEAILLDGNKLFFVPGGKDTNVVAMDRFTGKLLWISKGRGERSGYNSPILINLAGKKIIVTLSAYSLMGIDAETGEFLWFQEQDNTPLDKREPGSGDTHSNSVWYEDGFIYYIAGDGNGAVKLKLSPDGKQISQDWRNSNIDNYMGGVIKIGQDIYTCTTGRKDLKKIDAETGTEMDSLKCGSGAIIEADGMLIYYNQRGEMMLINPGNGKMEISGSFKVDKGTKEHFSHPVVDKGVLYIRHGKALMAYDIKI